MKLGQTLTRRVFAFPSTIPRVKVDGSETVQKYPIDIKLCCLPGLGDLAYFKDLIASSNYSVELYQDDLFARAFTSSTIEEYLKLVANEPGGLGLPIEPPPAGAAPAGKKAPPPAKGAPVGPVTELVLGTIQPSDKFLIQHLTEALNKSKLIRSHGCAKFRLEQLLEKSNDLLTKFRRKRNGGNMLPDDDHVIVKEDMTLEVRLEKPSKPEKWDLPSDMSLIKALEHAKNNAGKPLHTGNKNPPRHERFLVCGTTLTVTAELHRHLDESVEQIDSDLATQQVKFGKTLTVGFTSSSRLPDGTLNLDEKRNLNDEELHLILSETPFTRMIISCNYTDDDTLEAINNGVNAVNSRALPDIQGTIRSYALTPKELEATISGKLDVISGVMIIDDDKRLIVLEGLAAPNCGMELLFTDYLIRINENNSNLSILCNPEVLFPTRLYPEYSPDLRRIRVRGKLNHLAKRPEIYNRKQVEEICYLAVDGLMALKRAEDMLSTKQLDMYPSMEALNKLELLYGEAISRADMDGTMKKQFLHVAEEKRKHHELHDTHGHLAEHSHIHSNESSNLATAYQKRHGEFIPTECRNPQFEEYLKTRPKHRVDHLAENRRQRKAAWLQMLQRKEQRMKVMTETITRILGATTDGHGKHSNMHRSTNSGDDDTSSQHSGEPDGASSSYTSVPLPKIYLYSIQSENYKTKAWKELRHRIAEDHHANYTLSKDFLSQSITPIDEKEEQLKQIELEKSARLTQKGFQYPKPKTRSELITHPKKPSEARIEELKEHFTDLLDKKANEGITSDPILLQRERDYNTQVKPQAYFGALELPEYEYEFQLKYIGDREKLPRGSLTKGIDKNPHYFRSVHLGGENQRKIVEEALLKEKEEWEKKVIVDSHDFKVGGFKVRDKAIPVDRYNDILKGEPKRPDLQTLRDRQSHRGADWSYTTAPLTIMNKEEYVPARDREKSLTRAHDHTKFITATVGELHVSGRPKDFTRYINEHTDKPKMISMIAKKKHPPLDRSSNPTEYSGPRWDPPSV